MNSAVADYQVTTRFDPELYALYIAIRMFEQTHSSTPAKTPSVPKPAAGVDTYSKS